MKGFRIYPLRFWLSLVVLVPASWLLSETMLIIAVMFAGVLLPWLRHFYLSPFARTGQPYYHWLKTVPFNPAKELPNGNLMPGLHDAVIVAIVSMSLIRLDEAPVVRLFAAACFVALVLIMFTVIAARQLINLGPHAIGYFCLCLLLIMLSLPLVGQTELIFYNHYLSVFVFIAPVLVAFIASLAGLTTMMKAFPRSSDGLVHYAAIGNRTLKELTYGQPNLMDLGEPYTSLNPRAKWPRLESVHVWGVSATLATFCFALLTYIPTYDAGLYAVIGGAVTWCRMMTYYTNLDPTAPRLPRIDHFREGNWRRNFAFSLATLLLFTAIGYGILLTVPGFPGVLLATAGIILITVAAFRLPPSRAAWETTGFRQITLTPQASAQESSRKNHRTLKPSQ